MICLIPKINMIDNKYKYSDITSEIIKCAIARHRSPEIGLLINFGETSLRFKRLTNKKSREINLIRKITIQTNDTQK